MLGGFMAEQGMGTLSSDRRETPILQVEDRAKPENTPSKRGRSGSLSRRTTPDPSGPSSTREHDLEEAPILAPDPFLGVEKERKLKETGTVDALEAGGNTKSVPDLIRLNWNPS
jgi:hypothetical protein